MSYFEPSFPAGEYLERCRKVQAAMAGRDIDLLLCFSFPNICYLTGIESVLWYKYFVAIMPRTGSPILLAQDFEMPNALIRSWVEDRVTYGLDKDPVDATARLLEERGLSGKRIGIETYPWAMPVPTYLRLRDALSHAELVDAGDLVATVKVIKSPAEIACLRQAADLTSRGMRAAIAAFEEGRTDNDVAAAAYQAMIAGGSETMCLDPIVTIGEWSGVPHSTHCRRTIRRGDPGLLEMGACIHRYTAASMRTAIAGRPSDEVRRAADACIASLNTCIEHMKPGVLADEIATSADRAWSEISTRLVWHGIYGYSLGLGFPPDWNDCPALIQRGSPLVLQPAMVFHVTTSLREMAQYGAAFSETVLITKDSNEVLTDVPRELAVR
ncbi:MAG: M24 family metallopeptidase [Nitrososphaerales archaeon]